MKFKVFVGTMLVLIVLLLATLTGAVIYAGVRVGHETKSVTTTVNGFTNSVTNINKNLQNINSQLRYDNQKFGQP